MIFILRDDDTSYFTKPEDLEAAYGVLWGKVPLSLAVIPYDVPSHYRGDPQRFYQENYPISIEENQALISYIRQQIKTKSFAILLHGYSHLYKVVKPVPYHPAFWIPEFLYLQEIEKKLRAGRLLIERLFGEPVYGVVPPSNAISVKGIRALVKVGLHLVGAVGMRVILRAHPCNLACIIANRINWQYPFGIRKYYGHSQICSHPLTPVCSWSDLTSDLHECQRKNGIFVVATHYWELSSYHEEQGACLRDLLADLISRANHAQATFSTVNRLFQK
ncbi:MAG: DUF2334 domain-containing protein [Syntrophorhabdales bacterium]|jgi:hypothetical protein